MEETDEEITFTPISVSNKNHISVTYYNELTSKNIWRWSDGKHNKSIIGNFFAFYFHGKKLIFHKIIDIKGPKYKFSDWNYDAGQIKNILILSKPLCTIEWDEWKLLNGPQSKMGTYTTKNFKKERPLLYNKLLTINSDLSVE
jgi:hypothetical protein